MLSLWTTSFATQQGEGGRSATAAALSRRQRRRRRTTTTATSHHPRTNNNLASVTAALFFGAILLALVVLLWLHHRVELTLEESAQSLSNTVISPNQLGADFKRNSRGNLRRRGGDSHSPRENQKVVEIAKNTTTTTSSKRKTDAVHTHAIPNIVIFTHSVNLLLKNNNNNNNNNTLHWTEEEEDAALARNVRNTIALHPTARVRFLTDDDCLVSIQNAMGGGDMNSPLLLDYFQKETHGMYKADICRGAALYETGGLYLDVDVEARMNVFDAISPHNTTFVTSLVHRQSKHPHNFFQAFIGATPRNPIVKRYLDLFVEFYQGKLDVQGPLGVLLLRKAHDDVVLMHSKHHFHHDNKNDDASQSHQPQQVVSLWQEVLYHPRLFPNVPPPNWGTRRACHFVVVANPENRQEGKFVVPLYSRTKGSRMCGGRDTEKKKSKKKEQRKRE